MLDPVEVPNVQHIVKQRIKRFILEAGLREGDRLPTEEDLANQLGVSRTAIREALRGLESLGMIESRRGSGRYVRDFSFEPILDNLAYSLFYDMHTLQELLYIREKLETGFIELAIESLTPQTLSDLRDILSKMETRAAEGVSVTGMMDDDITFHRTLYELVGNNLLLKLLEVFWTVYDNLYSRLPPTAEDPEQFLYRHRTLVDAIAARDVALAQSCLIEHFEGVREWIAEQELTEDAERDFTEI